SYEAEFNSTGLPSGVYFYQLKAGKFISTKKMIFLK
ncbi:MAG: T9SS type A sorting domain-containing protein, partial [Ignavibacteriaceae bacterium]|nr:T9SS type A sorting domain-containing protein [Ignavibacteriaceae bacterium]